MSKRDSGQLVIGAAQGAAARCLTTDIQFGSQQDYVLESLLVLVS